MRFFHHRVMFFSLLLCFWYFILFLSPNIGYLNFGPIFCGHSCEAIQIIKFNVRSGKCVRICLCSRNEFKAKIIWLFLFGFRYFFSFCLSTHSLFFSLLNYLCCRLGHTTHISVKHFSVEQRSEINNWNLIFIKIERLFDMQ